tara:strand:- start:2782 stop:3741 length:960 start_codon:yes stop_codon:yes gene_type:complete
MLFKIKDFLREESGDGGEGGGSPDGGTPAGGAAEAAASPPDTGGDVATLDTGSSSGEPDANPFINNEGEFTNNWLDSLKGDEYESMKPTLARFKNIQDLSKSLYHSKQMIGKGADSVLVPGEESSAEEVSAYRKALGVPDDVADYTLTTPDEMPEGMGFDQNTMDAFKNFAHKNNIPPPVAQQLVQMQMGTASQQMEAHKNQMQSHIAEQNQQLKQEWGGTYEKNIVDAQLGARDLGINLEDNHPVFNEAWFVQAMKRHGNAVGEDSMKRGEADFLGANSDKMKGQDIMNNPQNQAYQKYQEGDEATVMRVRALLQSER